MYFIFHILKDYFDLKRKKLTTPTSPLHPQCLSHHLRLLADSHLTQVDGEDGVRAGALGIHLGAGCCAGQSAKLQTLQQLEHTHNTEGI